MIYEHLRHDDRPAYCRTASNLAELEHIRAELKQFPKFLRVPIAAQRSGIAYAVESPGTVPTPACRDSAYVCPEAYASRPGIDVWTS
jgi:hypothetical protein